MKTMPPSEPAVSPLPDALVEEPMAGDMLPEYDVDYSKTRPNRFAARLAQRRMVELDAESND